jgi:hypothetical protein
LKFYLINIPKTRTMTKWLPPGGGPAGPAKVRPVRPDVPGRSGRSGRSGPAGPKRFHLPVQAGRPGRSGQAGPPPDRPPALENVFLSLGREKRFLSRALPSYEP